MRFRLTIFYLFDRIQVHAPRSRDENAPSVGKRGITFPQSGEQSLLIENLSSNTFSNRPVKDEVASMSDFDGGNQLIQFPTLQFHPSDLDPEVQRASSDAAGTVSSTVQHNQWNLMPAEEDPGFYHGDIDPLTGQEGLIRPDLETRILRTDDEASGLEIEEEDIESEADTRFSDVETMVCDLKFKLLCIDNLNTYLSLRLFLLLVESERSCSNW